MVKINIKYPIWKTRSVGIAEHKITGDLAIDILYRNKAGDRIYPNTLYINQIKALTYPINVIKGVKLRIIPISDLTP